MRCVDLEMLELSKAWNMIGICLGGINSSIDKLTTWNSSPLGKGLAIRILKTFEEQGDIQNLALFFKIV